MISEEKLGFLERFGDSDHQDMAATIRMWKQQRDDCVESHQRLNEDLDAAEQILIDEGGYGEGYTLVDCAREMLEDIRVLRLQVEELEHSQMKRENNLLRKSITETNRNYVEVCNEVLELKRKNEELDSKWWKERWA